MKEKELRECAVCAACGNKIGSSGLPVFYRLTLARYGVDGKAMQRQTGLEMMMGGCVALAQVLGPDEDMTMTLLEPFTITVCETCSTKPIMVAEFAEMGPGQEKCSQVKALGS